MTSSGQLESGRLSTSQSSHTCSGKNTVCNLIVQQHDLHTRAYGGCIKRAVKDFGKDLGNLSALKRNYLDSNNAEMKVVSA